MIPWWVVGEGNVVNVQCYYTEFVKQPVVTLLKKFAESWKVWMTVATVFAAAEERVDAISVRRCGEHALHAVQAYSSFATTTDRNTVWRHTSVRP